MEQLAESTVKKGSHRTEPMPAGGRECRALILWPHVPHYLAACIRVLLAEHHAGVLLVVTRTDEQANHVPLQAFGRFQYVDATDSGLSEAQVRHIVQDFAPTVVVAACPKWGLLTRVARAARARGVAVVWAVDHYWRGTWRDYANAVLCRLGLIYTFCDEVWVPGSLGRQYARKLGFEDSRILEGVYACDSELFRRVGEERFGAQPRPPWPRVFLFTGQYIERKNIGTLLAAYSMYRDSVSRPWELWCAGQGPMRERLQGVEGVRDCGYQDATGCAELMSRAGAFVLPSWVDHWGVVIHEATCAGLPILASRTCAATANLVRDGYNGFTFAPQDAKGLCGFMRLISDEEQARRMGRNSLRMSHQFDPRLWADMLLTYVPSSLNDRRGRADLSSAELHQHKQAAFRTQEMGHASDVIPEHLA
jgi:glycosyltransferase involved in cell wall biosynthesis